MPPLLLETITHAAASYGLMPMGALHDAGRTILLVGTRADFWSTFQSAPEAKDGQSNPIDRYSQRVIPQLAEAAQAHDVVYPFGGPPYAPFISWAKATGEAFDSPTGMLVHITAGLMISYRGALVFDQRLQLPQSDHQSPCKTCTDRPCETACPVSALSANHFYDVPTCKAHIASNAGQDCITAGCTTRLACPVSQTFGRPAAQSAYHMRQFRGELG